MLKIHHLPVGETAVNDFTITINGESVAPWFCRVSAVPYNTPWPGHQRPLDQTEVASFISFEMDEPVQIKLTAAKDFEELVIRPLSKGVQAQVNGRDITFTIDKVGYYTIESDGSHNALHIFANPVTDFGIDKEDPNVIYYGPGVHEAGDIVLEDDQTLFIDGGAVVYGYVTAYHKKNVRIVGYGVIDGSREKRGNDGKCLYNYDPIMWDEPQNKEKHPDFRNQAELLANLKKHPLIKGCIHLFSCTDCQITGIICRDSAGFTVMPLNCERMTMEWIKIIGNWRYNSDGIDPVNCRYIHISDCFIRTFDDCIAIKATKGWDLANVHHISVTGCTIWNDWGRCLDIGEETCADEYYDILWDDCDLLHGTFAYMEISNGDRAHVHDMLIRNIRCEYNHHEREYRFQTDMNLPYIDDGTTFCPKLIHSYIGYGPFSADHILGRISHIRFEDIKILCPTDISSGPIVLRGPKEDHCSQQIVIENVTQNGRRLKKEEYPVTVVFDEPGQDIYNNLTDQGLI